jgi:hypothetical protein
MERVGGGTSAGAALALFRAPFVVMNALLRTDPWMAKTLLISAADRMANTSPSPYNLNSPLFARSASSVIVDN